MCTRSDVKRNQLPEAIWVREKSNIEFHGSCGLGGCWAEAFLELWAREWDEMDVKECWAQQVRIGLQKKPG